MAYRASHNVDSSCTICFQGAGERAEAREAWAAHSRRALGAKPKPEVLGGLQGEETGHASFLHVGMHFPLPF